MKGDIIHDTTPLFPHPLLFSLVAFFCYNRPEHTRRALETLAKKHLAPQSRLFIFSDDERVGTISGYLNPGYKDIEANCRKVSSCMVWVFGAG